MCYKDMGTSIKHVEGEVDPNMLYGVGIGYRKLSRWLERGSPRSYCNPLKRDKIL